MTIKRIQKGKTPDGKFYDIVADHRGRVFLRTVTLITDLEAVRTMAELDIAESQVAKQRFHDNLMDEIAQECMQDAQADMAEWKEEL